MIVEEIQSTNDIEQVQSTRQEISEAWHSRGKRSSQRKNRRFVEMINLFDALAQEKYRSVESLEQLREFYDQLLSDEVAPEDAPDGELFRRSPVHIDSGLKRVHTGVMPESALHEGLKEMLRQSRDESIPQLIRCVASHYIVEYVHPFFDGNGRLGRFLLSMDLARAISPIAWFALSQTISMEKSRYYKAFAVAEEPRNRGDVTPFIASMLSIIATAMETLMEDLQQREDMTQKLWQRLHGDREAQQGEQVPSLKDHPESHRRILFVLGQTAIFGADATMNLEDLSTALEKSKQLVRADVKELEQIGLIQAVKKRPLVFALTEQAAGELLG